MNEKVYAVIIRYILVLAVVLIYAGAAVGPRVQVTYRLNDVDNANELECYNSGFIQSGARFTFRNPDNPEQDYRQVVGVARSYPFAIHPSNESLVSCTVEAQESNRIMVAAIPQYTGVSAIRQYIYSDTAIAEIECPFQLGRLSSLYEFSWRVVIGDVTPLIPDGTQGVYWLTEEKNRILYVNISAAAENLRSFQCVGAVQTCTDSTSCRTEERNSPTITITVSDSLVHLARVTNSPNNITVNESEVAIFNCTAIGTGDLNIDWDVDGYCTVSNCDSITNDESTDGYVTSTLEIICATNLTVTCIVNQSLTISNILTEEPDVEIRLPPPRIRILRRVAQLTVIPAHTTTITTIQPVTTQSIGPVSSGESDGIIIGISSSITGIIIAVVCCLMVIAGGIIIRRYYTTKKVHNGNNRGQSDVVCYHVRNGNDSDETGSTATTPQVMVRATAFPPSLIIKSANLRVLDPIGHGEFGIVYKGYLADQYINEFVAIKTLKGFIDDEAVQELLSECAKMKNLNHPHVMTLKGVCLDGGPVPYIVLPYMANGSLLSYLKKERSNLTLPTAGDDSGKEDKESQVLIIKKELLGMCLQVAKGMNYLAGEKIVHRDLAARNCMIDMNMVIKVADFGLSVNTGTKEYCRLADMGIKLPVMWMAPESLSDYIFSEKSDVWSYGVTCWEIFTGGLVPYVGTKPSSLLTLLQQGGRLELPNNSACSTEMYSIMMWCWEMEPGNRPSFSALVQTLSKSLENVAGYLPVRAFAGLDEENTCCIQNAANAETDQQTLNIDYRGTYV